MAQYATSFVMTVHFAGDRINTPIALTELDSIFERLIEKHILSIVALDDKDTFTVACSQSDIHIPCAVSKKIDLKNGSSSHKTIVIIIMRKTNFKAKQGDIIYNV